MDFNGKVLLAFLKRDSKDYPNNFIAITFSSPSVKQSMTLIIPLSFARPSESRYCNILYSQNSCGFLQVLFQIFNAHFQFLLFMPIYISPKAPDPTLCPMVVYSPYVFILLYIIVYAVTNTESINFIQMDQQSINNYINPDSGNTFKIDTRQLQSQFQCTVCLNPIEDCYITRCGHVYCRKCIQQTVDRHHRCPFCNQPLNEFKADVFKNYHFNTIKKIVHEEKRQQATKYLNKVFAQVEAKENQQRDQLMKPIQQVPIYQLQRIGEIFKDTLLRYRDSLVNLFEIEKKAEEKKIMLGIKNIRDNDQIIKDLQIHLLNNFPAPIISPDLLELSTSLNVLLPGNKWNKSIIKLSPMSTLQSLLPILQNICSEQNIILKGKIEDELIVNGMKMPVRERFGSLAGKKIQISGGLPFQVKIFCYTHNWNAGKTSDFYICQKCNIKWICQSCILYCHEGHESKMQLKNHKGDWAICYCVSKGNCKAINKNNQ